MPEKSLLELLHSRGLRYRREDSFKLAPSRLLAARRNAAPIYLEVGEEGTARRSYDINLYKANLTLAEIEPVLLEAAARYALPQERFAAFYSQLRQRPFGHLSGGFARDGSDFLTVYYETQPL